MENLSPKTLSLIDAIASSVDGKYRAYVASCRSYLFLEFLKLISRHGNQLVENERLLRWLLSKKGIDFYRSNHFRHRRYEVSLEAITDSQVPTVSLLECSNTERTELLSEFLATLSKAEKEILPVFSKEQKGVDVAKELGVSSEAISKRVRQLRRKADCFSKRILNDRN